jgi:hypothetical protein
MKLYCFLLLIILLCLLYDNNLYEGNDHEYDTSLDSTVAYTGGGADTENTENTFLYYLDSIAGFAGINLSEYVEYENSSQPIDCEGIKTDLGNCEEALSGELPYSKDDWEYDNTNPQKQNKQNCMNCLRCRDKGLLTDEFYASACDALVGCYDTPGESLGDTMPYFYAYSNINWNTASCPDSTLKPLANKTCNFMKNNSDTFDKISYIKKREVIECTANIGLLNSFAGSLVQSLES